MHSFTKAQLGDRPTHICVLQRPHGSPRVEFTKQRTHRLKGQSVRPDRRATAGAFGSVYIVGGGGRASHAHINGHAASAAAGDADPHAASLKRTIKVKRSGQYSGLPSERQSKHVQSIQPGNPACKDGRQIGTTHCAKDTLGTMTGETY